MQTTVRHTKTFFYIATFPYYLVTFWKIIKKFLFDLKRIV
nr:MAG TPA: hypothetical protein [Caudoviricetes sp.]